MIPQTRLRVDHPRRNQYPLAVCESFHGL